MAGTPRMPPGPRFAPVQTVRYLRDSFDYLAEMLRTYGDPVTLTTLTGTLVVTGDPEGARELFTADPGTFNVWSPELIRPLFGPTSLFVVSGEHHQRGRKLLAPAFHGARVRRYGERIAEATRRATERLRAGQHFRMLDLARTISVDVILGTMLGVVDGARFVRLAEAVATFIDTARAEVLFFPYERRGGESAMGWKAFAEARKRLLAELDSEIQAARSTTTSRDDLLAWLADARFDDGTAMSDAELRDELLTVLLAGHETVATAFTWAMYWLHRTPRCLEALTRELDTLDPMAPVDTVAALPYLGAVCNESLRLYPIAADVTRTLRSPLTLKGYDLPVGCTVSVALCVLHSQEDLFPDPATFRPERFLERRFTAFEFAPFGGGARRCIGAAVAQQELAIALATLVRTFRFHLDGDELPKPTRGAITFSPSNGVPLVFDGPR